MPFYFTEADLTDRTDLKSFNEDYAYWLVVIDAFSRKVWARLIKRKTEKEVVREMEDILQSMDGPTVKRIRTDRGSEFKSRGFQRLMRELDIEHSFPYVHAAMVEVSFCDYWQVCERTFRQTFPYSEFSRLCNAY